MAIIKNIAVLNVIDIKEDLANEVTELKNIGLLIESDKSQELMKGCKKTNIGSTIKIPSDMNLKIITINGELKIDKEYLEGLVDQIVILVNGSMEISKDVDVQLFNEKVYKILLNGSLACPNKLKGIIASKSAINGSTNSYNNDHKYISGTVRLNNRFLKGFPSNSKVAFEKLIIIDEIDLNLFKEKISNIQILNKLIIVDKYEDIVSQIIEDYYKVKSIIIPNSEHEIKYFNDDIKLDDSFIKTFDKSVLYVEGDIEIILKEDIQLTDYISYLISDTLIINEKYYNQIKGILSDTVEVQIVEGKMIKNIGVMNLEQEFTEHVTIKNMGKLRISNNFNFQNFEEKVIDIINFGVIEVPNDKLPLVQRKIKQNYGKIKDINKIEDKPEEIEDVLYSNIADLKL